MKPSLLSSQKNGHTATNWNVNITKVYQRQMKTGNWTQDLSVKNERASV